MSPSQTCTEYKGAAESVLVSLAMVGDTIAFNALVIRRQEIVRNFMRRLCNDAILADDLSQLVFLQAWQNISTLNSANAYGGWLKKLAVNVFLQHCRKKDLLTTNHESPLQEGHHRASVGKLIDLDAALIKLPPLMRLCVVLSYNEGMSHTEVSESTGIPLGTVKSHIKRGSLQLREWLSDYRN